MKLPTVTAYLAGAPYSLPDFTLRASYASVNKGSGVPSYYYLTTPMTPEVVDAIEARPGATVHLLLDGVPWDYFTVAFLRLARGARSSSITLGGERQSTNGSPKAATVPLASVMSEAVQRDGSISLVTAPFSTDALAGDTLSWRGTAYTVTRVSTTLAHERSTQTLTLKENTP